MAEMYGSEKLIQVSFDEIEYVSTLNKGQLCFLFQGIAPGLDVSRDPSHMTLVTVKKFHTSRLKHLKEEFDEELALLSRFDHPNIVKLLGFTTKEDPHCMIFELMELGRLDNFLREAKPALVEEGKSDVKLSYDDFLKICSQVASGMNYLVSLSFLCRNLGPWSCLVANELTVKIADFRFLKHIFISDFEDSEKMALRWMPPETLIHRRFTVKSNVYSYGVLMWQVFTYGSLPFKGYWDSDVTNFAGEAKPTSLFLLQPDTCPTHIYDLMCDCWAQNPEKRPDFEVIIKLLAQNSPHSSPAQESNVQWRQASTKHRLKFQELVKIVETEPSAVTVIGTYRACFKPEFVIGYGSSGTIVYIGLSEDGIEVAVKSIPIHICKELGENEKEILNCPSVRKESHIVNYRFYTDSVNSLHGYLVLDLHEESLKDYVFERSKEELTSDGPRIIHEVLCGLKALHCGKEEILHRDLKPENILVSLQDEMVLSDFGISRKLRKGQTTHKSGEKGTDDWIAVESLLSDEEDDDDSSNEQAEKQVRYKKQSDIQVIGMLLFYILSKGGHPYGKGIYRKVNVLEGKPVNVGKLNDPVAKDLIGWMLQHDPKDRPSVRQCLQHPYLLTTDEQFNLVTRVGNEMEIKTNDVTSVVVKELNADPSLPKPSWKPQIDPEVLMYASGYRRHRPYSDSMADLLRLIRNTAEHWRDRKPPSTVEVKVGKPKEYFLKLFPTLPVVLHRIIRNESDWNQREPLKQFFL